MRHIVIANARAGTVLEAGPDVFAGRLESAFAACRSHAEIRLVHPTDIDDALSLALESDDAVPVIAGGDGSINKVLPVLIGARRPVGILPMGTVNVLGRDLGLYGPLEQQVAALCGGRPIEMDLGRVNDRLFHSLSGMGFFSLMAREREQARRRFPFSRAAAFALAATRSILFTRPVMVDVAIGGEHHLTAEADAVLVTVNSFDGADGQRPRLDGGAFEVHVLKAGGLWSRGKAALAIAAGRWRGASNLVSFSGEAVTLHRRDARSGHVTFDGEVERRAGTQRYTLLPRALNVIAARPARC